MPISPELQSGLRVGIAAMLLIDSAILVSRAMEKDPEPVKTELIAAASIGELATTLSIDTVTTTTTTAPTTITIPARPVQKPVSRSGTRTAAAVPKGLKAAGNGAASVEQLDALGDCESGDHDGLPPYVPNPTANTGNGFKGAFQWKQRSWDTHVAGMRRHDLVGAHIPGLSYELQREITQGVPISAWPRQFPACYGILRQNGII